MFLGLGHLGQSWESIGLAVPGANSLHHCSNNDTYPDPRCWCRILDHGAAIGHNIVDTIATRACSIAHWDICHRESK